MKRLLSLLLAIGLLASFIGHGLAHGGNNKEDACAICSVGPLAVQAEPEIGAPMTFSCEASVPTAARAQASFLPVSSARAPPR